MFRFTQEPSSGSQSQCLAITLQLWFGSRRIHHQGAKVSA